MKTSPLRSLLTLAGAGLLVAVAGATVGAASETATDERAAARPGAGAAQDLVVGRGIERPETMEEFLTAVTEDVDRYWTARFDAAGLPEPRVSYAWIPPRMTAASVCGADGPADQVAAYCS